MGLAEPTLTDRIVFCTTYPSRRKGPDYMIGVYATCSERDFFDTFELYDGQARMARFEAQTFVMELRSEKGFPEDPFLVYAKGVDTPWQDLRLFGAPIHNLGRSGNENQANDELIQALGEFSSAHAAIAGKSHFMAYVHPDDEYEGFGSYVAEEAADPDDLPTFPENYIEPLSSIETPALDVRTLTPDGLIRYVRDTFVAPAYKARAGLQEKRVHAHIEDLAQAVPHHMRPYATVLTNALQNPHIGRRRLANIVSVCTLIMGSLQGEEFEKAIQYQARLARLLRHRDCDRPYTLSAA